ncbi:hypothetical protein FGG08_006812 [Glutinoglossum americanum]|uniref:Xylanolytic transcriptional activator regulatory domain-containing protein n=1 Tax=Glutinoglossum americanum TaxID=1670608 RepID=A0A9P8I6K1_9PEZI|nr:hypothetical protein FGG08_006812 [Glutinoglossum americanum]
MSGGEPEADLASDDRVRRTMSKNRANSSPSTTKPVPEELPMDTNGDQPPNNGVDLVVSSAQQDGVIPTSEGMLPPLNMTDFLSPPVGGPREMVSNDMGVFGATSALFDDSPPPQQQPTNGSIPNDHIPMPEPQVPNAPNEPNAPTTHPPMCNEDLYYLQAKGAFDLPERSTQEELVFLYFSFVHPFLPLLDEPAFWNDYGKNIETNFSSFSLVVYQSMLFAASAFLSYDGLRKAGFKTVKEARQKFFMRARLLFDLDYERDDLRLIQSGLLLSFWMPLPNERRINTFLLSGAITLAKNANLHRDPAGTGKSRKERIFARRLWWCCILRDRSIALALRHQHLINHDDHDVPPLTLEDFEDELHQSRVYGPYAKYLLGRLCISMCRLGIIATKLVAIKSFPNKSTPSGSGSSISETDAISSVLSVEALNMELRIWFRSLSDEEMHQPCKEPGHSTAIVLHRKYLEMVYCGVMIALHQVPSELFNAGQTSWSKGLKEQMDDFRQRVRSAACTISVILEEIGNLGMLLYLPVAAAAFVSSAAVVHLIDVKTSPIAANADSRRRLRVCTQALEILQERYVGVDFVNHVLNATVEFADKELLSNWHLRDAISSAVNEGSAPNSNKAAEDDETVSARLEQFTAMRITSFLDRSISNGQLVTEADLPSPKSWDSGDSRRRSTTEEMDLGVNFVWDPSN